MAGIPIGFCEQNLIMVGSPFSHEWGPRVTLQVHNSRYIRMKCIDCSLEYRSALSFECEFCGRKLCKSIPQLGTIELCSNCRKQHDSLVRAMRQCVIDVLSRDCTSVVLSYLCPHSIMELSPMWGFLTRVSTSPNWQTHFRNDYIPFTLVSVARIKVECYCSNDLSIAYRPQIQIGYNARLYPEKDAEDVDESVRPAAARDLYITVRHQVRSF